MLIDKIKLSKNRELRISKDSVNGKSFIQLRVWEIINESYKPTMKGFGVETKQIHYLIKHLSMVSYLENQIKGKS
tara:strand:- start:635 stop:859 length:225 start_codon:yes stop_codon:yes gene_type:complete